MTVRSPARTRAAAFVLPMLLVLALGGSALAGCTRTESGSQSGAAGASGGGLADDRSGAGGESAAPIDAGLLRGLDFDPRPHEVERVIDGDTVHIDWDGGTEKVRLIGINTPETGDGRRAAQCFGAEASAFAKDLYQGHDVYVATDPSIAERDQYDRLLAYVWLDDGTFVNLAMLEEGYANEFTFDRPYEHRDLFRQASRRARDGDAGLWSPDTCDGDYDTPPNR